MQHPNQHGVYAAETTIELAREGRSYVNANVAECDDGLFRFALCISTSVSGYSSPITKRDPGFASAKAAEDQALSCAIDRLPSAGVSDPQYFKSELIALQNQLRSRYRQPSLF